MTARIATALLGLAIAATGVSGAAQGASAAPPEQTEADVATKTQAGDLAETSWRLVRIMSMDDRVDRPGDASQYSLEFGADGMVAILADCNRGSGPWTSVSPGQLQFGPVAVTGALCQQDSLSEKFLAQFQWVRSYVLKDGHLFLATKADGSIIEFEPSGRLKPAATVLGEGISTSDGKEMQQIILTRLFGQYAAQHAIRASESEIATYVENLERAMAADPNLDAEDDLTPEEAGQISAMRSEMARSIIRQWKLNRALYGQYGGRIIYQQFGPEPLDAYLRFLEERQRAGAFAIHESALNDEFWHYFTDESIHTFMPPGSDDEARAFTVPPWEQFSAAE